MFPFCHPYPAVKPPVDMKKIWSGNMNTCPDWVTAGLCVIALKEEYLRHSCRVCSLAEECWPGLHEGSVHSMQSGQSNLRQDREI